MNCVANLVRSMFIVVYCGFEMNNNLTIFSCGKSSAVQLSGGSGKPHMTLFQTNVLVQTAVRILESSGEPMTAVRPR